ncbi:MAG TPA: hypothetical protein VJH67_03000 [Candidatus Paceibacterota bacterium]
MKKNVCWAILALIALITLTVSPVSATTVIDFTSPIYSGATGNTTFAVVDQGIFNNLTASGGVLNWTPGGGLGINGPTSLDDPSEIGLLEVLGDGLVPPLMTLYDIYLGDIYTSEFLTGTEQAQYRINGGAWITVSAVTPTSGSGLLTISVNLDNVSQIDFRATKLGSDFSVRGYSAEVVPEMSTIFLSGTGLLGLGLWAQINIRRRRQREQQKT